MFFMSLEQSGGEEVRGMGGRRAGEEVNPPPHSFTQHLLPYPPPKDTLTPGPEGEEEAVGPQTTQRDGDTDIKTDRH